MTNTTQVYFIIGIVICLLGVGLYQSLDNSSPNQTLPTSISNKPKIIVPSTTLPNTRNAQGQFTRESMVSSEGYNGQFLIIQSPKTNDKVFRMVTYGTPKDASFSAQDGWQLLKSIPSPRFEYMFDDGTAASFNVPSDSLSNGEVSYGLIETGVFDNFKVSGLSLYHISNLYKTNDNLSFYYIAREDLSGTDASKKTGSIAFTMQTPRIYKREYRLSTNTYTDTPIPLPVSIGQSKIRFEIDVTKISIINDELGSAEYFDLHNTTLKPIKINEKNIAYDGFTVQGNSLFNGSEHIETFDIRPDLTLQIKEVTPRGVLMIVVDKLSTQEIGATNYLYYDRITKQTSVVFENKYTSEISDIRLSTTPVVVTN
jgi:hypothetical protein